VVSLSFFSAAFIAIRISTIDDCIFLSGRKKKQNTRGQTKMTRILFLSVASSLLLLSSSFCVLVNGQAMLVPKFNYYAGYLPVHSITDLAALDLDQYAINIELLDRKLLEAYHIYREGGHSGSYATLTLSNADRVAGDYEVETIVYGVNSRGENIIGYLRDAAIWTADELNPIINVTYPVGDRQATYSNCTVGGLWRITDADRDGCFVGSGELGIGGSTMELAAAFSYDYEVRFDNRNDLTLQSLSLRAGTDMKEFGNRTHIPEYHAFVTYYGDEDYADKYITAAYLGQATKFTSGKGNVDFSTFATGGRMGQAEAMRKGIVYLSVWMQVVLNLRTAADNCHDDDKAIEFVDDAVALYTGSLVATGEAKGETGIFLHGLADARAHQFNTAGHQNNQDEGTAYVNIKVMEGFRVLKQILISADLTLCDQAEKTRQYIIDLMKVPLVQGLLRYTYIRQHEINQMNLDDKERTMADSATFAATLLPLVHQCDPKAAEVIHQHTMLSNATIWTDYSAVHNAISSAYDCLGIDDCGLIGGVWDDVVKEYKTGGYPCGMEDPSLLATSSKRSVFGRFARFVFITGLILATGCVAQ
jgi:hypothetical protein